MGAVRRCDIFTLCNRTISISVHLARSSTSLLIKWSHLILRIDLLMSWRYRVPVSLHTSLVEWCTDCILWISSLLSVLYSQNPCPWASPSQTTQPKSVLLSRHLACSPWWHSYQDICGGLLSSICAHQWRNPAVQQHSWFIFSWCWSWDPFSVTSCCMRWKWQYRLHIALLVCVWRIPWSLISNAWDQISRRRIWKEPGYYNRDLCPSKQGKA